MESFRVLCDVVGERFVAFSFIAGVRFTGLLVDSVDPPASLVDFVAGEDEGAKEQQLTLGDFRRRIVDALLSPDPPDPPFHEEMGAEALSRLVGGRYLLLAPLYGVRLLRLVADAPRTAPDVVVEDGGEEVRLSLHDLRQRLRAEVRSELGRSTRGPFALDLGRVSLALDALAADDSDRVVELLGSWPGPLSLFLRTPAGAALSAEHKDRIGEALAALGEAYRRLGRGPWSEEIFRLGLQYAPEGPVGALLFLRLAHAMAAADRHGEAIGPYRRALALGGDDPAVLVALGRAYAVRGRHVAAVECYRAAVKAGVAAAALEEDIERSIAALGPAGESWRARALG